MSRDIRSFFIPSVAKPKSSSSASSPSTTTTTNKQSSVASKRKKLIISSDDEDDDDDKDKKDKADNDIKKNKKIQKTPPPVPTGLATKRKEITSLSGASGRKRRIFSDSDDEEQKPNVTTTRTTTKKLKSQQIDLSKDTQKNNLNYRPSVDVQKMLGGQIKVRVERPVPVPLPVNSKDTTNDLDELLNDEMDTLISLINDDKRLDKLPDDDHDDDAKIIKNAEMKSNKLINKNVEAPPKKSPRKLMKIDDKIKKTSPIKKSPIKSSPPTTTTTTTPPLLKPSKPQPQQQQEQDEEAIRLKKQQTAIFLQTYKNRDTGPLNPGSKEIPKSHPNCLNGLTFVITGLFDSLGRDEIIQLINNCGGRVTTALSKKTTHLICGTEAGHTKMEKAKQQGGTKIFNEDDLFNLIRERTPASPISVSSSRSGGSGGSDKKSPNKTLGNSIKIEKKSPKSKLSIEKTKQQTAVIGKIEQKTSTEITKHLPGDDDDVVVVDDVDADRDHQQMWVDKYKPMTTKQIIGQQGAASNCAKLTNWLKNWYINQNSKVKKNIEKPSAFASTKNDGSYYKACLLSGQPGVGKTTTATLVCRELDFAITEFNASDTRSKKLLQNDVTKMITNKSLHGYFLDVEKQIKSNHHQSNVPLEPLITKRHVLIMDEVDGMAGNEDRGGVQELIGLIKNTGVPIICMCNDVNHPKIRSLINYCYDLRFTKPRVEQIKGAMLSICFREKIKLDPKQLEAIILATNQDVRQTLNTISLLYSNKMGGNKKMEVVGAGESTIENEQNQQNEVQSMKKDLRLGPWDVIRKVFSFSEHQQMTIFDKSDLFFHDYSLSPLFVQQNYLSVIPRVPKEQKMLQIAKTADSLSIGDVVDRRIRTNQSWSMLPIQAMFSSVLPGEFMAGTFSAQIIFPKWLGKNSNTNKRNRLAQELHDHTRIRTSASRLSIRLDYAPMLLRKILLPLQQHGLDGVRECLDIIKEYRLLREDLDSLIELTTWPGLTKNPMDSIAPKVKAALTRAYNKEVSPYTYTVTSFKKKRGGGGGSTTKDDDDELNYNEDGEENRINSDDDEDDDDDNNNNLDMDVLIKANTNNKKKLINKNEPSTASKTASKTATTNKTKKPKT